MTNPNLNDELKTDIDNFLDESYKSITQYCTHIEHTTITDEALKLELEECLEQYCDDNNLSIDIQQTVEDFLNKRGDK